MSASARPASAYRSNAVEVRTLIKVFRSLLKAHAEDAAQDADWRHVSDLGHIAIVLQRDLIDPLIRRNRLNSRAKRTTKG